MPSREILRAIVGASFSVWGSFGGSNESRGKSYGDEPFPLAPGFPIWGPIKYGHWTLARPIAGVYWQTASFFNVNLTKGFDCSVFGPPFWNLGPISVRIHRWGLFPPNYFRLVFGDIGPFAVKGERFERQPELTDFSSPRFSSLSVEVRAPRRQVLRWVVGFSS